MEILWLEVVWLKDQIKKSFFKNDSEYKNEIDFLADNSEMNPRIVEYIEQIKENTKNHFWDSWKE